MIALLLLVACRSGQVEVAPEIIHLRDSGQPEDTGEPDGDDTGQAKDTAETGQAEDETGHSGDTSSGHDSSETGEPAGGDDTAVVDSGDTGDTAAVEDPDVCEAGDVSLIAADLTCDDGLWTIALQLDGDVDASALVVELVGPYAKVATVPLDDAGCCLTYQFEDEDCTTYEWSSVLVYTYTPGTEIMNWCAYAGPVTKYDVATCQLLADLSDLTCSAL